MSSKFAKRTINEEKNKPSEQVCKNLRRNCFLWEIHMFFFFRIKNLILKVINLVSSQGSRLHADRSVAFNRDLSAVSSSGPLSIALDAPGGKSCGSYHGAAIGYTYSAKFSRARSMGTTVDRFSMRFGPRPARYPPRPCISLILDDYIDVVVKSTERSPVNSHFSLNHDTR